MIEINITRFFRDAAPMDYSASRAEIGDNAGPDTWRAACDDSADWPMIVTEKQQEAFRAHMRDMGFSEGNEMESWDAAELNALFLQLVAGDIRESGIDTDSPDWDEYERGAGQGAYAGAFYRGDDGDIYYYLGANNHENRHNRTRSHYLGCRGPRLRPSCLA